MKVGLSGSSAYEAAVASPETNRAGASSGGLYAAEQHVKREEHAAERHLVGRRNTGAGPERGIQEVVARRQAGAAHEGAADRLATERGAGADGQHGLRQQEHEGQPAGAEPDRRRKAAGMGPLAPDQREAEPGDEPGEGENTDAPRRAQCLDSGEELRVSAAKGETLHRVKRQYDTSGQMF